MMKKIICLIILINLSVTAGQYEKYTDPYDNSIYYFWPFQDPPFDSLDIFFNAPKCKASESNCTIKIIPCNMTCDPTINCSYFISSCNSNAFESSPLNILKAFTISNDNIKIASADPDMPVTINIIPQSANVYNTDPKTLCVAFNVDSVNVSFTNLKIMTFDQNCISPDHSVLVTTPLVFSKAGTVFLDNVTWNSNGSLAVMYNPSTSLGLHLQSTNLQSIGTDVEYDIILLNVQGSIDSDKVLLLGESTATTTTEVRNISHYINILNFESFGCLPTVYISTKKCDSKKRTIIGLSSGLGVLIFMFAYISGRKIIKKFNERHTTNNTKPKIVINTCKNG